MDDGLHIALIKLHSLPIVQVTTVLCDSIITKVQRCRVLIPKSLTMLCSPTLGDVKELSSHLLFTFFVCLILLCIHLLLIFSCLIFFFLLLLWPFFNLQRQRRFSYVILTVGMLDRPSQMFLAQKSPIKFIGTAHATNLFI